MRGIVQILVQTLPYTLVPEIIFLLFKGAAETGRESITTKQHSSKTAVNESELSTQAPSAHPSSISVEQENRWAIPMAWFASLLIL